MNNIYKTAREYLIASYGGMGVSRGCTGFGCGYSAGRGDGENKGAGHGGHIIGLDRKLGHGRTLKPNRFTGQGLVLIPIIVELTIENCPK